MVARGPRPGGPALGGPRLAVVPVDLSAVVLPDHAPAAFTAAAREAQATGLRTLWTYDHLSWRDFRDGPWFSAVPLLAAAATATDTIRLGTLVASPNFRHPVPFAAELQTLDHLSGGRLDLGVGAGTSAQDAHVLGLPALTPADRQSRFEEWTDLLAALLSQRRTDAAGRWFTAADARVVPGPVQSPLPLTVAAAGPRGMRFAARTGAAWVTYGAAGDDLDAVAAGFTEPARRFSQLLAEVAPGRAVRRLALVGLDEAAPFAPGAYAGFLARLEAAGFDEVCVHWPRPDGRGVPAAVFAEVLAAHGLAERSGG